MAQEVNFLMKLDITRHFSHCRDAFLALLQKYGKRKNTDGHRCVKALHFQSCSQLEILKMLLILLLIWQVNFKFCLAQKGNNKCFQCRVSSDRGPG